MGWLLRSPRRVPRSERRTGKPQSAGSSVSVYLHPLRFEVLEQRRLLAHDILIAAGGAAAVPAAALSFADNSNVTIDPAAFATATANVDLKANNAITFQDAVSLPAGIALSAQANQSISVEAGLTASAVQLSAADSIVVSGAVRAATLQVTTGLLDNSGELSTSAAVGGQLSIAADRMVNSGQISADGSAGPGGNVAITLAKRLIQTQAGQITASGTGGPGGQVTILVGEGPAAGGTAPGSTAGMYLSGSVAANGDGANAIGGQIAITAPQINVYGGQIRADGQSGGGEIRLGGDFHGQGTLPPAQQVTVNSASLLSADALARGDGGQIVVWSQQQTGFAALVTARGGAGGGDGGRAEVSGQAALDWRGQAIVSAAAGQAGSLLLDPQNIDVAGPAFSEFVDPDPAAGNKFGYTIVPLSTGNVVITSPFDGFSGASAGAVYLFNGATGALISMLRGSKADDAVGCGGVTALTNGNYVVYSYDWTNGSAADAGAATWESGTTGVSGVVSSANSLVGSAANDEVGCGGVTALTNGNYVVCSPFWQKNTGAVTWGNGTAGVSGTISSANSLVGSAAGDTLGYANANGVTALSNGNYVVSSPRWSNGSAADAGAVTWGSGTTGVTGVVSSANSLVGSAFNDEVGYGGVTALSNSNYVVSSPDWINGSAADAGAVTWGSGTTGVTGVVSSANSLVGSTKNDQVGGVTVLTNGNYVVYSYDWTNGSAADAGAATWGSGTAGVSGVVSSANSLVGSAANDEVGYGGVTALSNGNYVVSSQWWINGSAADAGAVTWGSGTTGVTGVVSSTNSLVGSATNDRVGYRGVTALSNGNYVVCSPDWINGSAADAGAATWESGTGGGSGTVSTANSLVGSAANDQVGYGGVTALSNGNYVVSSRDWINGSAAAAGAVTWGSGTTGVTGTVSSANSLVGSTANDNVGWGGVTALTNGNYVVYSYEWANGSAADAGAATWGSGTAGVRGVVSSANSLVGSAAYDQVGYGGVTALSNGNYVVSSPDWSNGSTAAAGAVTWGSGTTGVTGVISSANSLVGLTSNGGLSVALDNVNGTFYASFPGEAGTTPSGGTYGGRVFVGSQSLGIVPPLSSQTFAAETGQTVTLDSNVAGTLSTGASVTLQASNDITLSSPITANNPGGNGGNLLLQAGRRVLLNANITTANGNLTLTANDTAADGVVNADRQSGSAGICMAAGTTLNVGSGTLAINLLNGAGNTYNAVGVATLANVAAASTLLGAGTVLANGAISGPVTVQSGAVLGGSGSVSGATTVNGGGSLAPGNGGIATLTISNTLTLAGGATATMDIDAATATGDLVQGLTTVTYGGTLSVTNLAGTLALGTTFTLFSAAGYAGSFTTINLPTLPAGLQWDTSKLTVNGSITVTPGTLTVPASTWTSAGLTLMLGSDGCVHVYTTNSVPPADVVTPCPLACVANIAIAAPGGTAGNLTIDSTNGDPVPAGGLNYSGAGGLIITGPGIVALCGTNNYTGGTTVSAGTLRINAASALPDGGSLTIGAGGAFSLDPSSSATSNDTSVTTATPVATDAVSLSPASLEAAAAVVLKHSTSGRNSQSLIVPPAALQLPQSVPAVALGIPAADRVVWSSTAKRIVGDQAGLEPAANSLDNSDQQRKKDVAILALDAVFAECGR